MEWWEKVVVPVKQAWVAVAGRRVKPSRKSGPAFLKLHDDVQTCEYKDVQVMWEKLRTEMELELSHPRNRNKRPASSSKGVEHRHHHHHPQR